MTKITDLTGAVPDSADVFPYVDVSDTTEDAAGTAKKATLAQIQSGLATSADLTTHTGNTSNPHSVTAAQVGALAIANNLSDLNDAATARANLGLGTMAVEAAGDYLPLTGGTMTGALLITPTSTATVPLTLTVPAGGTGTMLAVYNTDRGYNSLVIDHNGRHVQKEANNTGTLYQIIQVGSGDGGGGDGDEIFSVRRNGANREVRMSGFTALGTTSNPQTTSPSMTVGSGFNSISLNAELRVADTGALTSSPERVATFRASSSGTTTHGFGGNFTFYAETLDGGETGTPILFDWYWKRNELSNFRGGYKFRGQNNTGSYSTTTFDDHYVNTDGYVDHFYYGEVEILPTGTSDVGLTITTPAGSTANAIEVYSTDAAGNVFTLNDAGDTTIAGALNHDGSTVGFFGTTPAAQPAAYTPTNVTTDRAYDANSTTLDEIADVLGTLIADLQSLGLIG